MSRTFDIQRLSFLDIVQKRIAIDNFEIEEGKDSHFDIDIGVELRIDVESDILCVTYHIDILFDEDESDILGQFQIEYYFKCDRLAEFTLMQEGKMVLDQDLAKELNSIAYSTTRGIIAVETRGTMLEKLILPIIVPETLIGNIIQIEDEDKK